MRSAIASSLILFAGISTSAVFLFQSLEFVAGLVHDEQIESTLSEHLGTIKKIHDLQQKLVIERLNPHALPWAKTQDDLRKNRVVDWLKLAKADEIADLKEIEVRRLKKSDLASAPANPEDLDQPIYWMDRDRLIILNYIAIFPKGDLYASFKSAEDVKQRYQLIGAKLDESKPRMMRDNGIVLVVSGLLLGSIFIFSSRRFASRVLSVIEGFETWAEEDQNFRFTDDHRGELKLITANFNAMADDVEANRQKSLYLEKIASWQIIARKLAHEIKNPLTPIQMMVSQLKRRYKGDDPDFTILLDNAQKIITEEVSGLRRMVDNFSNFARLPQPDPKEKDLNNICAHVVELQKNAFPEHKISFRPCGEKAMAKVDEDLIRQVILNLIKNAAEACGETPSRIETDVVDLGSVYMIRINDNGPGVPDDLKARIFEAYFTTKHTGPTAGMGLGLAVCQKIVLDHGGKLALESKPGNTTFTISLPKRMG